MSKPTLLDTCMSIHYAKAAVLTTTMVIESTYVSLRRIAY